MAFEYLTSLHPTLFHIIIAISSIIVLAKSADMMVYSISDYAKKLGISDYLIGFLVVSIGTALPELVASINGASINAGQIVFGTIIGSNSFKIPLLGLTFLIVRKIKYGSREIGNAPIITTAIAVLPFLLVIDNYLSRIDGVILLVVFSLYIIKLWKGEGKLGRIKKNVKAKTILKDSLIFILAFVALLLSARWLVFSSLKLSSELNISTFLIGIIVIGIGASAPEITVQIRSIIRKHQNLGFGNIFGSIVTNSTLVLGIVAIIKPVKISFAPLLSSLFFILFSLIVSLLIINKKNITWKHGAFLVGIYVLYLLIEILF